MAKELLKIDISLNHNLVFRAKLFGPRFLLVTKLIDVCLIIFFFRMVLLNYFIIISKVVPRAQRYVTGLMYLVCSSSLYDLGPYLKSPNALSAGLGALLLSPVIF